GYGHIAITLAGNTEEELLRLASEGIVPEEPPYPPYLADLASVSLVTRMATAPSYSVGRGRGERCRPVKGLEAHAARGGAIARKSPGSAGRAPRRPASPRPGFAPRAWRRCSPRGGWRWPC